MFIILFLVFGYFFPAQAKPVLEAREFKCEYVVSHNRKVKVERRSFMTKFRGEQLEVFYQVNRKSINKNKDVTLVIPGLDKESFELKLQALGQRGQQAISIDLTNINGTGPFDAPTPEEDAQILNDLLVHLGLTKRKFKKNLFVETHSRGSLVLSRLVREYPKKFRISGVVMFNPYMGWITTYLAQTSAETMSAGIRWWAKATQRLPGLSLMTEMAADVAEAGAAQIAHTAMGMYLNIHRKDSFHRFVKDKTEQKGLEYNEEETENLRQKLIGMEFAEVKEDLQLMADLNIPILVVRGDEDDLVPDAQIDSVAEEFRISVLVYKGTTHYTPYERDQGTADLVLQAKNNVDNKRLIESGISAVITED